MPLPLVQVQNPRPLPPFWYLPGLRLGLSALTPSPITLASALSSPHLPGPRQSSRSSASAIRARTVGRGDAAAMAATGGLEGRRAHFQPLHERTELGGTGVQARGRSLHSSWGGTCWPGAEPTGRGPSCRSEPHRVPHRPHPGHAGCPCTGAPPLGSKATDARHAGATEGGRGQGKGWGDGPPGPSSGFSPSSPSAAAYWMARSPAFASALVLPFHPISLPPGLRALLGLGF